MTTDNRTNEPTPELVTISYQKDGKTYLLSIPSEHAEWAEEMLSLDLAEVERAAAEEAWEACLDEASKQGTIQEPDNPYRREETE